MERLGLHGYFSFFGCLGDTASPKPEPDIYRHVANSLGVKTSEAIALEDSCTGVLAARRANLWVAAIPNQSTKGHDFGKADWVLASMRDFDLPRRSAEVAAGR